MAGVGDDLEVGLGPGVGELLGGRQRADHVVAALDDRRRQVADARQIAQELAVLQETAVHKVVALEAGQLLRDLPRIRHLPAAIVQGRYDVICPLATAQALADAWPEAAYEIVPDAGHSAMEPGIKRALVAATDGMRSF